MDVIYADLKGVVCCKLDGALVVDRRYKNMFELCVIPSLESAKKEMKKEGSVINLSK